MVKVFAANHCNEGYCMVWIHFFVLAINVLPITDGYELPDEDETAAEMKGKLRMALKR